MTSPIIRTDKNQKIISENMYQNGKFNQSPNESISASHTHDEIIRIGQYDPHQSPGYGIAETAMTFNPGG
jgi:hypothetical protein